MIAYFVLGIGLLFGLLLLARWIVNADPRLLAWAVKVLAVIVVLGFGGIILATERVQWALYVLPLLLPFFFHWRSIRLRQRNAQGPAAGGRSTINTGWLSMELDHDSGTMRGTVQRGRFAGRGLAGMSVEELRDLLDEVADDADSVGVLEAYLDRTHGADWRQGGTGEGTEAPPRRPPPSGGMSAEEALDVLGLAPGAKASEIKEAHRRLMAKLHPDRGGSTYLAAKLNQAKDVLLKRG
jgi:hypothetical protein